MAQAAYLLGFRAAKAEGTTRQHVTLAGGTYLATLGGLGDLAFSDLPRATPSALDSLRFVARWLLGKCR